jgi:formate dehydrogenase maturation protein FdhE
MKITDLLNEEVVSVIGEESLVAIQEAFEKKVELTTEAALISQDEVYAEKLDQLIQAIDKDHSTKMKRVVEAVDADRTQKLLKVVNKYERALNEDSATFKKQMVGAVSAYLDEFLEESISIPPAFR